MPGDEDQGEKLTNQVAVLRRLCLLLLTFFIHPLRRSVRAAFVNSKKYLKINPEYSYGVIVMGAAVCRTARVVHVGMSREHG